MSIPTPQSEPEREAAWRQLAATIGNIVKLRIQVYAQLARRADRRSFRVRCTQRTFDALAKETGCTDRMITTVLEDLQSCGVIEIQPPEQLTDRHVVIVLLVR